MIKHFITLALLSIAVFAQSSDYVISASLANNGAVLSNSFISGFISTVNSQQGLNIDSSYLCGFNSQNNTNMQNSTNSNNSTSVLDGSNPNLQLTGPITVTFSPCYNYGSSDNSQAQVFSLSQLLSLSLANLTAGDITPMSGMNMSLDAAVWNVTGPTTYFNGTQDERVSVSFTTIMYLPEPTSVAQTTAAPATTVAATTAAPATTEAASVAATSAAPATTRNPSFIPPNSPVLAQPATDAPAANATNSRNYMNITYTFTLAINDPFISISVQMTSPSLGAPDNVKYVSVCYAVAEGQVNNVTDLASTANFGQYAGDAVLFSTGSNLVSYLENGFGGFHAQPFWYEFILNSTSTSAIDRFTSKPAILRPADALLQGTNTTQAASAFCDIHTLWNGLLVHEYQIGVAKQVTVSEIASLVAAASSTAAPATTVAATTSAPASTVAATVAATTTASATTVAATTAATTTASATTVAPVTTEAATSAPTTTTAAPVAREAIPRNSLRNLKNRLFRM